MLWVPLDVGAFICSYQFFLGGDVRNKKFQSSIL